LLYWTKDLFICDTGAIMTAYESHDLKFTTPNALAPTPWLLPHTFVKYLEFINSQFFYNYIFT